MKSGFKKQTSVINIMLFLTDWLFSARILRMLYRLYNNLCSIGVIWEDNLGCRTESLDINEPKIFDCHWHYFKQNIFTVIYQYGAVFHLGGKRFSVVLCCSVTAIWYLSTDWRLTFVLISWGTYNCLFPFYCWPSMQENHNHGFVTVHECCKHKNIMEINISVQQQYCGDLIDHLHEISNLSFFF